MLEDLILKLLKDPNLEFFEDSLIFRTEILDVPSAAEILVQTMENGSLDQSARAGEMLALFGHPGMRPVAERLVQNDSEWRTDLLLVLRLQMLNADERDFRSVLQELLPYLLPLLDDARRVAEPDTDHPLEVEYEELRVCDEAYLILAYLDGHQDEDEFFRDLDDQGRNDRIRRLQMRWRPPIAPIA